MNTKLIIAGLVLATASCQAVDNQRGSTASAHRHRNKHTMKQDTQKKATVKVAKTEEQWRSQLAPDRFRVLRKGATERAFTGQYWKETASGSYVCAGCGHELFSSRTKFDSGCGWPSFSDVAGKSSVITRDDNSLGMRRIEVLCARCDGHLGHVFPDGPGPTGLRYCINSASLELQKETSEHDGKRTKGTGTTDVDR